MYFLLNLSHCVKFWPFSTMLTHQIWSCHVTQDANLENVEFCPISTFDIGKSHKLSYGKVLYFKSYQPKTSPGGWGGGTKCL